MQNMQQRGGGAARAAPTGDYGSLWIIASGNQVMRDAAERDRVSMELGDILYFEMVAAGLMNGIPCLVIRGICDYADSHKNKKSQAYAAGTVTACRKEVLSVIRPTEVAKARTVDEIV
jgi:hypothetical protein